MWIEILEQTGEIDMVGVKLSRSHTSFYAYTKFINFMLFIYHLLLLLVLVIS